MNLEQFDRISVVFPKESRENRSQGSMTGAAIQTRYM